MARGSAQIAVGAVALVGLSAGWLYVNEFRLRAVEREYGDLLKPLVTRRAPATEIEAALRTLHDPQVYRLGPPDAPAIGASDRRQFAFVLSTAYVKATVLLDAEDRTKGFRIERSGTAL